MKRIFWQMIANILINNLEAAIVYKLPEIVINTLFGYCYVIDAHAVSLDIYLK